VHKSHQRLGSADTCSAVYSGGEGETREDGRQGSQLLEDLGHLRGDLQDLAAELALRG